MYEEELKIIRKERGSKKPYAWRKGKLREGKLRVCLVIYQLRNNLPYRQLKEIFGYNSGSVVYYRFIEWIEIIERILKKIWAIRSREEMK